MADRRALVGNASSERQVERARGIEKALQRDFEAALSDVLNTHAGVIVWTTLLDRFNAWRSVFTQNALGMSYLAGKQDVAHELMQLADSVPGSVAKIFAEHARRQSQRAAAPASSPDMSVTDGNDSDL